MMERKIVEVVLAVIYDVQACFLMNSRPDGKVYSDYWEFPGGKVEPGENFEEAIRGEIKEELDLTLGEVDFFLVYEFEYPHAHVRLHFCHCRDWSGVPVAKENQRFSFFSLNQLPSPILPSTDQVIQKFKNLF